MNLTKGTKPPVANETIKLASNRLRGTIVADLVDLWRIWLMFPQAPFPSKTAS